MKLTPTRYRAVTIQGDLVSGQMCCTEGETWATFRGSERVMKVQHVFDVAGPETCDEILMLGDSTLVGRVTFDPRRAIAESTDFALLAMLAVAEEWWEAHNPGALWPWALPEVQKP